MDSETANRERPKLKSWAWDEDIPTSLHLVGYLFAGVVGSGVAGVSWKVGLIVGAVTFTVIYTIYRVLHT